MRQEITIYDAIGKPLDGVWFNLHGELLLTFGGDAFTVLDVAQGYDPGEEEIKQGTLDVDDFGDDILIEAGVATAEELRQRQELKRKAWQEQNLRRRRELYEELRRQFGPTAGRE